MPYSTLIVDVLNLLTPPYCIYCSDPIKTGFLCTSCRLLCGRTDHFSVQNNQIIKRLKLRCKLDTGAALYYYTKSGPIQGLIHQLKYKGWFSIGLKEGYDFGKEYNSSALFNRADMIIPIPTHWRRKIKRSYNQSAMFAQGICKATGIIIREDILLKHNSLLSQTKKNRQSRGEEVTHSFDLIKPKLVVGKRILLVDDVMTTGATAEAAINILYNGGCSHIQLALLALAIN